jgi:hypothetical protein
MTRPPLTPLDDLASRLECAYWRQPWSPGHWHSLSERAREGWRRVAEHVLAGWVRR